MASHGYNYDDDIDIVDPDGWNQYESRARRRAPQQCQIHMVQQVTTIVAPAYDAIEDWCGITELEPEKSGRAVRNRFEGDAAQHNRLFNGDLLRDPTEGVDYFKKKSCSQISSREPRQCSCIDSCSS